MSFKVRILIEYLKTMDRGSQHCTGSGDQKHSQGRREMLKGKMVTKEALTISEKRRKAEQGKGKI